jgi:mannose-1-phosphate guanylyltransferase
VRAIVLVGGFGTRLRPLTLSTPKQMLPVVHRPMIERVIESLAAHGIDEVVLSLGYRPDAFLDRYPDDECAGVRMLYAVEPEPLDTAGAIAFAAAEASVRGTFVVVNGDVLSDVDITELVAFHRSAGAETTIALTRVDDPSRFGVVPIDEHGRVESFVEKPPVGEAPTNWINAGTYVCESAMLDRIPPGRRVSIEREVFPAMVADRVLYAWHSPAYWVDAGTPSTYLSAQLDLIDGRRGDPESPVAADATVDASATVDHSVIMSRVSVAAGAVVRDSVLLPGATVAAGARVEGSMLGAGAVVGPGAVVTGLSVVGNDAEVPAGSTLDGVRLPDDS